LASGVQLGSSQLMSSSSIICKQISLAYEAQTNTAHTDGRPVRNVRCFSKQYMLQNSQLRLCDSSKEILVEAGRRCKPLACASRTAQPTSIYSNFAVPAPSAKDAYHISPLLSTKRSSWTYHCKERLDTSESRCSVDQVWLNS
jgi:hypothetical protein